MQLDDLVVEVRAADRKRVGQIGHQDLVLKANLLFNNVGAWTLTLPATHKMSYHLSDPAAGIVVTGPNGVLFSGLMTNPLNEATTEDPSGTITFSGVTDDIHLADSLAWPEPSNGTLSTQKKARDVRTGSCESLMHAYVNANIGPSAPSNRRVPFLVMGTDFSRGSVVTKRPRFKNLGELVMGLASTANLGFRVVDVGNDSDVAFETYEVEDLTGEIRLDIENGQLASQKFSISPPTVTHAIVQGQGDVRDRNLIEVTTTDSLVASAQWARRIEQWVDQSSTTDTDEMTQAGLQLLQEGGFTVTEMEAIPAEDAAGMEFGKDWYLGDRITVVLEDTEFPCLVTGAIISIDSDGFRVGVQVGPPGKTNARDIESVVRSTEARVAALEANASSFVIPVGTTWEYEGSIAPPGWLMRDGAEYLIADYPDLYDLIGNKHNTTGDGIVSFNVPDDQRRAKVGAGTGWPVGHNEGIADEAARSFIHDHGPGTLDILPANGGVNRGTGGNATAGPTHDHDITGRTGNAYGSANEIPHIAVNYIIKT